jgi:hypothetical protein
VEDETRDEEMEGPFRERQPHQRTRKAGSQGGDEEPRRDTDRHDTNQPQGHAGSGLESPPGTQAHICPVNSQEEGPLSG